MHSRLINEYVCTSEGILRQTPGIGQTRQRQFIDHQLLRGDVPDWNGGRVGAAQDLCRQLSGLFSYFMKVGALVKKGAALWITWSDGEHGEARFSRERDDRVERQQDRVVTPDPDRLSAPRYDGIGGLSHCRRVVRVRLQQVNPELAVGLTHLFGEDARIGLPGVPHHAHGFETRKEFSGELE